MAQPENQSEGSIGPGATLGFFIGLRIASQRWLHARAAQKSGLSAAGRHTVLPPKALLGTDDATQGRHDVLVEGATATN